MTSLRQTGFLPILIILITFFSVNQWSSVPFGNTTIYFAVSFAIIASALWCKWQYFQTDYPVHYRIILLYFVWLLIGVIRGCFVADNYWEWRNFAFSSLALSVPLFVYVFSIPEILRRTLRFWFKFALPAFGLFFFWVITRDAYQFYLAPVLLLACFLPILPKKWIVILIALLGLMVFADLGARSQIIKALIAFMISGAYLLSKYVTSRLLNFAHWICYVVPIVLLYLGINGIFNPFEAIGEADSDRKYASIRDDGIDESIGDDTRTFIYEEVITSAVRHNYIWYGRTPARGNDTGIFDNLTADELKTGKYERQANEVCHPNIFTWLGLIGVILYSLIYLTSSYLALYQSNNIWMKLLGIFIAFRWAYGWVEDVNAFDILNITLWMLISMGLSEKFRAMTDREMEVWIISILKD